MKKLRLVFDSNNGERKDITLPMEEWISDWWYECDFVPSNDTVILGAELDGKCVLDNIKAVDERYPTFEEIAWHFNWDGLHDDFHGEILNDSSIKNSSDAFKKWLLKNVKNELS